MWHDDETHVPRGFNDQRRQFSRLRSLAAALATYDGTAELDEGLAIVLAGLRSQLLS